MGGVGVPVRVGAEVADGRPDGAGRCVDCGGAVPCPDAFGGGDVGSFEAAVVELLQTRFLRATEERTYISLWTMLMG